MEESIEEDLSTSSGGYKCMQYHLSPYKLKVNFEAGQVKIKCGIWFW